MIPDRQPKIEILMIPSLQQFLFLLHVRRATASDAPRTSYKWQSNIACLTGTCYIDRRARHSSTTAFADHGSAILWYSTCLLSTALCQCQTHPQSTSVSHQSSSGDLLLVIIPWVTSSQEIVNRLHSTTRRWSSSWHRTSDPGPWMFLDFKPLALSASRSSMPSK